MGSNPIWGVWFHLPTHYISLSRSNFVFFSPCRSWPLTSKKEICVPRGDFLLHLATNLHQEFRQKVWQGRWDACMNQQLCSQEPQFSWTWKMGLLISSHFCAARPEGCWDTNWDRQSAVWWQQGWVHLSQYSHPSPLIALLLQGWKLPSKHPPPLPLRFALKFPIVCLLQSNACSLAQNYSNWFLLVLDRRCCEQGLLSRCGARASPVVEHGC